MGYLKFEVIKVLYSIYFYLLLVDDIIGNLNSSVYYNFLCENKKFKFIDLELDSE